MRRSGLKMVMVLASGFLLLSLATRVSTANATIASLEKTWPRPDAITVCFLGGGPDLRREVALVANEWSSGTGIHFVFGHDQQYRSCSDERPFDIRVEISPTTGNWAYIGTDTWHVAANKPTMGLNINSESAITGADFRYQVLHQFGHAIGFLHQEQDPNSRCRNSLDPEIVTDRTKWPPSMVDQNIGPIAVDNGKFISTGDDVESVMRLFTSPEFFLRKDRDPCYSAPSGFLSSGDLRAAALLYPPRPADVRGPNAPDEPLTSLSIRMEGPLASDHFGYVLDALFALGKVQLSKYVSSPGKSSLSTVLVSQSLLPRNSVSRSVEDFLCKINRHICESDGKNIKWSNIVPSHNYVEDGLPCPNEHLARVIFCLPNIRLESYRLVSSVSYNPSNGSLRVLVPEKLGGCDNWDVACRDVIVRLNRPLRFLPNGELPSGYVGNIWLPMRAYRIPIHYDGPDERNRIERSVASLVAARAKALNVAEDKILIRVTDPVGSPKPTASSPPMVAQGLDLEKEFRDPLKVMGYPDPATLPGWQSGRLRQVQIAVWDRPIQGSHCAFTRESGERIFVVTPWTGSIDDVPPEKAAQCGQMRDDAYRAKPWFDHGTFVAGILAAQIPYNGRVIMGAEPWLKIWSWELVSAAQINAAQDSPSLIMAQNDMEPVAINISQSFPIAAGSRNTALEGILFGSGQSSSLDGLSLIVAPAGGPEDLGVPGRRIDDLAADCNIFPACWSGSSLPSRGIVSVVALNRAGTDLLKTQEGLIQTNYGEAFDVSAIGDAYSSYYGDWVGRGQGSSYAAPYVTALAAMIHAKLKGISILPPPVLAVKWRILASADPLDELQPTSQFGRINFSRALSFERDVVKRYLSGGNCGDCTLTGIIDRNPTDRIIGFTDNDPIPFSRIKRIMRNADGTVTVYWVRYDSGRQILIAGRHLTFSSPNEDLKLRDGTGQVTSIKLSEIADFTACAFVRDCTAR